MFRCLAKEGLLAIGCGETITGEHTRYINKLKSLKVAK